MAKNSELVNKDFEYPNDDEPELDFSFEPFPVLSEKALHGIAGRFVALASKNSEADPAAILFTFLTRAGVEFGNKKMPLGDGFQFPRLYTAIVGKTAKARKGTSAKPVIRCFDGLVNRSQQTADNTNADHDLSGILYQTASSSPGPLSSGEGIVYAVRDKTETFDKATNEYQITDPGVADKRLFILDEEMAGALSSMARKGNTLSTILRTLWDSGSAKPLIKNNPISCTDAHAGIVTHTTIDELREKLESAEYSNGFANRFLWVCARRQGTIPFPEPMPEPELNQIRDELISAFRHGNGSLYLSESSRALWAEIYPDLSKSFPGILGNVTTRAEAQTLRLSMVYALLDCSSTVEPAHIEAGLAAWQFCFDSAKYIFDAGINPDAEKILKALKQKPVSAKEIYIDVFQKHKKSKEIGKILHELIEAGRVIEWSEKTAGRDKKMYELSVKSVLSN